MGTTSPALVVPQQSQQQQDKITDNPITMKTQTMPLRLHAGKSQQACSNTTTPKSEDSTSELNRVGQSVFYDCIDGNATTTPSASIMLSERAKGDGAEVEEKQDIMKPERNDTDEDSNFNSLNTLVMHVY